MDKEFYIFAKPIKTELCEVRFLKYFEYIENLPELSMMSLNVLHYYYQYRKLNEENSSEVNEAIEALKDESLYQIVMSQDAITAAYYKVFQKVIDDQKAIEAIFDSEELFMQHRQLIMEMNMLSEEEVSPNPEIQKAIERSRRVKQKKAEKQSYSDIISSVVASTSNSFKDIGEMTVLQVYSIYYRISAIFNYQASTLFATVAEKVQIESWNKHIDLFSSESDTIERNEFDKKFGGMFD